MAKRFTDTDKWKRQNFRELPLKMKCVWQYLTDSCDHAGIWHPDFGLMSFQLGAEVTRDEVFSSFGHKLVELCNGALFLPSFIEFQYGKKKLSPTNNAHRSVIDALIGHGVDVVPFLAVTRELTSPSPAPGEPLVRGCPGAQDKDKDKDKDKEKDQEKDQEGGTGGKHRVCIPLRFPENPADFPGCKFHKEDESGCMLRKQWENALAAASACKERDGPRAGHA